MRLVAIASVCLISVFAFACSSSNGSNNNNETVGAQCDAIADAYCTHVVNDCNVGAPPAGGDTVRTQCTQLAASYCARAVTCGAQSSTTTCTTSFVSQCCETKGFCDNPSASYPSAIAACNADLSAEACSDMTSGITPSSCASVIKAAPTTPITVDACKSTTHEACCGDNGTCGQTAQSSSSSIDSCVQSMHSLACSAKTLPSNCEGVVKTSLHVATARGPLGAGADFVQAPAFGALANP